MMSEERRAQVEAARRCKTQDEMVDHFNGALHKAADDLGILEGEERDDWRLSQMEDVGLHDEDDFALNISEVLAKVEDEVRAARESGPAGP